MNSIIVHVCKRLFGLLFSLVACVRRIFCCWGRKSADSVLPMTMPAGSSYQSQRGFDEWDSWTSMQAQKSVADQYREMMIQQAAAAKAAQDQAADSESALDFFQDMAPSLRKSKKIRIRSSGSDETPASPTEPSSAELGTLEDDLSVKVNAWEADELASINADQVLKELRQKDRESRMLQHSQRKLKAKFSSGDRSSGFDAVKLS